MFFLSTFMQDDNDWCPWMLQTWLLYVVVNSIGMMMKFQVFEFANLARVSLQGIHVDYIKNQW